MKQTYLVCYDILDDGRLRSVARLMCGFGRRLQLSVFECRLSERSLAHLRWKLSQAMAAEDRLLIVGLCRGCSSKMIVRNLCQEWPGETEGFVVI